MNENKKSRWGVNWSLIVTIWLNAAALIGFFVKMDSRVSELERWRNEITPWRVTQKDLLLLEEKIKNINSNVSDIKSDLKDIKRELKI